MDSSIEERRVKAKRAAGESPAFYFDRHFMIEFARKEKKPLYVFIPGI
jgi:hypothetical protein